MDTKSAHENRRDFLKTLIPAGTMLCIGCPSALSSNIVNGNNQEQDFETKIKNEFSISWEQSFENRYSDTIIWMKTFAEHFDKEDLIDIIKEQVEKWNLESEPNAEAKSVKDFISPINENELMKNCLEYEYLELTDEVCQLKIINCLWARTFRSRNAGDFGYALCCHGDFTAARAFNPKLRMERTKTLMQGHDSCNHRYIWEG